MSDLNQLLKVLLMNLADLARLRPGMYGGQQRVDDIITARESILTHIVALSRYQLIDEIDAAWLYVRSAYEDCGYLLCASCPYSPEQLMNPDFYANWNDGDNQLENGVKQWKT
jgi:hypothetical protein